MWLTSLLLVFIFLFIFSPTERILSIIVSYHIFFTLFCVLFMVALAYKRLSFKQFLRSDTAPALSVLFVFSAFFITGFVVLFWGGWSPLFISLNWSFFLDFFSVFIPCDILTNWRQNSRRQL